MKLISRSATYSVDRATLKAFGRIKINGLQVVRSMAIAMVCITGGVVVGTAAQAATNQGADYEGVPLTLVNDTNDEVILFLHQEGDRSAYTRFANMPPCTERPLAGSYSRGWKVSQNLNTPMPINQAVTSGNKIYTTRLNNKETKHQCVKYLPTEIPEQNDLVQLGLERDTEKPYEAVNVGGISTLPNLFNGARRAVAGVVPEVDNLLTLLGKQNEEIARTLKQIDKLPESRLVIIEDFTTLGPEKALEKYPKLKDVDREVLSAISLKIEEQAKSDFMEEWKRVNNIPGGVDTEEIIMRKGEAFYALVKNSGDDLVNLEAVFKTICGNTMTPERLRTFVATLMKLVSIAEKQKIMPIAAVASKTGVANQSSKTLVEFYEASSEGDRLKIKAALCPANYYQPNPTSRNQYRSL